MNEPSKSALTPPQTDRPTSLTLSGARRVAMDFVAETPNPPRRSSGPLYKHVLTPPRAESRRTPTPVPSTGKATDGERVASLSTLPPLGELDVTAVRPAPVADVGPAPVFIPLPPRLPSAAGPALPLARIPALPQVPVRTLAEPTAQHIVVAQTPAPQASLASPTTVQSADLQALITSAKQAVEQLQRVVRELERQGGVLAPRVPGIAGMWWTHRRNIAIAVTVSVVVGVGGLLTAIACTHTP